MKSKLRWSVASDYVFLRDEFLNDFPQFAGLFRAARTPIDVPLHVTCDDVRSTLAARFSASLTLHKPGRIPADLASFIPHLVHVAPSIAGYMTRFGEDDAGFHIAVTTHGKAGILVDRGTVLHEFGHYIEQRVAAKRRYPPGPFVMRNTAFKNAYGLVTAITGRSTDDLYLRSAADEIVAWINAIWLCWILNIDRNTVLVGMVLDTLSNPECFGAFVCQYLPLISLAKIFSNRAAAEQMFASAGPHALRQGLRAAKDKSDVGLCEQIDRATSILLAHTLVHHRCATAFRADVKQTLTKAVTVGTRPVHTDGCYAGLSLHHEEVNGLCG